ncbi:MAG: nucleotidyltransferase [Polyangia bacterium]
MVEPGDPLEAGLSIASAFEEHGVPYAIGGALAYGLWGVPRATVDVDMNVFVETERISVVVEALRSLGIETDLEAALRASRRDGMFAVKYGMFGIDLFTPSIDFAWEAQRTRVRHAIEGREADFLSAEALCVFKLMFFRPKDIVDLQRLIAVRGKELDTGYVRRHVVAMMGEDDERIARWDELVERHADG